MLSTYIILKGLRNACPLVGTAFAFWLLKALLCHHCDLLIVCDHSVYAP